MSATASATNPQMPNRPDVALANRRRFGLGPSIASATALNWRRTFYTRASPSCQVLTVTGPPYDGYGIVGGEGDWGHDSRNS
ncbi:hypothetical protein DPMN_103993 [Dreissena polymorpha]|nr:hypothetical protein DPMN_103993 [Dreissena polymorpha]